ncbi:MAG: peptidylprolyl isomerase [Gammaproteobacteria bacterium]|nr:MAG: peptidylprolyl isomerase [Gammaproteobacteria bacterium]RTZ58234.1 MAG: peptidylprolyl isomerase [Gammaproteobacteria bacterium]
MQISKNKVASINYVLKDNDGNVLDESSDGSFAYLHGANNIIPGLENALEGKKQGDDVSVTIAPEDGYGEPNPALVQKVPRGAFPDDMEIKTGMQFQAAGENGQQTLVTVTEVQDDEITVDGNHPMAGKTLNFTVKVGEVRDASEEELSHGHVHGPDGHHH